MSEDSSEINSPIFGLQRRIPHSVEAEIAVLGALLLNSKTFEKVAGKLLPEHFVLAEHAALYRVICDASGSVDIVYLSDWAEREPSMSLVEGKKYLSHLLDHACLPINASEYAKLLIDLAIRRDLISCGEAIVDGAYDGEGSLSAYKLISAGRSALDALRLKAWPLNGTIESWSVASEKVEREDIEWLWEGWLPKGRFVLITGDGEVGKSLVAADLSARLAKAGKWPDGTPCSGGKVLYIDGGEESFASEVTPRLDACGAPAGMVRLAKARDLPDDPERVLSGFTMAVVSPVGCLLPEDAPEAAENSNKYVRTIMYPWLEAAEKVGCCLLGIAHPNKKTDSSPRYRVLGSVAWTNLPRVAHYLIKDKHSEDEKNPDRLLFPDKGNIGIKPDGLRFVVKYEGPLRGSIRPEWLGTTGKTLDEASIAQSQAAKKSAAKWLEGFLLEKIEVQASIAQQEGQGLGYRADAISQAMRRMSDDGFAHSKRRGFGDTGEWWWKLGAKKGREP